MVKWSILNTLLSIGRLEETTEYQFFSVICQISWPQILGFAAISDIEMKNIIRYYSLIGKSCKALLGVAAVIALSSPAVQAYPAGTKIVNT